MLDKTAHPNTKTMLEAWRRMESNPLSHALAGGDSVEASALIGNIFVLREGGDQHWTFRTAGEALHRYFGKQVANENFVDLWLGADRGLAVSAIQAAISAHAPAVIRARGETLTGKQLGVEIALAPLPGTPGLARRMLGHYQPLGAENMLGARPVWRHVITEIRAPQRERKQPYLRLVSSRD